MSEGDRLDGGYGFEGDMALIILLENMSLEERKKAVEDLKKEDPLAFEEFCEDYPEIVKELEL